MPPTFFLVMAVILAIPLTVVTLAGIGSYYLVRWTIRRAASRSAEG